MKKAAFVLALVMLLGCVSGCGAAEGEASVQSVSMICGLGSVGLADRFAGIVSPLGETTIKKNDAMTIDTIKVKVGDSVKKGDVLLTYDLSQIRTDLEMAQLELEQLNATLEGQQAELENIQKLMDSTYDDATKRQYALDLREQNVKVLETKANIATKKKDIEKLKANTADSTVKSPVDGEVLMAVDDAERRIVARWPEAARVFIEVESMRVCLDQQIQEASWEDEYEDEYEEAVEEARLLTEGDDEPADAIGEVMEAAEEAAEVAAAAALAAEEAAAIAATARAAASAAEQEAAEALAEHAAEMHRLAADRALADKAVEKIAGIGTVSLENAKAVNKARKAYDKLTPSQQAQVDNYQTLMKAEKKLKKLKKIQKMRRKAEQEAQAPQGPTA